MGRSNPVQLLRFGRTKIVIIITSLENSQIQLFSSQSLNGDNSASRRATEVPKKGKSLEFNPQDYEQVKSSPSLTVWSHEGSNLYPKIAQ